MDSKRTLLDIFHVSESYKLPDVIMDALLSDNAESIIRLVKKSTHDDIRDIFQQEQGDRKTLKQDFTPDCICTMVAKMMKPGSVLDMCSGTGILSKAAAKEHGIKICEQEFSERTIPFALLDACIDGLEGSISRADCLRGNIMQTYHLEKNNDISIPKQVEPEEMGCFDNVIMNPPYSMKFPEADETPIMGHKIPKSKADYGFILRGVQHLKDDGRLIAILPHGVLFRGAAEGKIREWLVKEHWISAVIGLPDKLFLNTAIPVFLLILEKNSPDILFIDASRRFEKKSAQNDMSQEQIRDVADAFFTRKDAEKYAYVASYQEIKYNDYNLNIPRYVDTFEPEPLPDAEAILKELQKIENEERKTRKELYEMLGELVGSKGDMNVMKEHRKLLKPQNTRNTFRQMTLEDYENAM